MNIDPRAILTYRWAVFLLSGGYCLYQLGFGSWGGAGGPFRYLTIWALFLSCYVANRMLTLSLGGIIRSHESTAICASILNIMVVLLYWRLYFTDPSLVNGDGLRTWWLEYYLHALGPALQVIDALFIGKVYRRFWRAVIPLMAIIAAYVAWSELYVQRFNDEPVGTVTTGLPYPFLNSMEWPERAMFYGVNAATALGLLASLGIIAAVLRRVSINGEKAA